MELQAVGYCYLHGGPGIDHERFPRLKEYLTTGCMAQPRPLTCADAVDHAVHEAMWSLGLRLATRDRPPALLRADAAVLRELARQALAEAAYCESFITLPPAALDEWRVGR